MNAQNLSFFRNGFTQGWARQRLDCVGETPRDGAEAFALPFPLPKLRVNERIFAYLRLFSLILAYLRLSSLNGKKMFEGAARGHRGMGRTKGWEADCKSRGPLRRMNKFLRHERPPVEWLLSRRAARVAREHRECGLSNDKHRRTTTSVT